MNHTRRLAAAGSAVIAAIALTGGGLAANAAGPVGEDDDTVITGAAMNQASQAALAHTDEGTVTGTEVGDEESLYEVEVTLDNGVEVDVQLDADFNVVDEGPDGTDD